MGLQVSVSRSRRGLTLFPSNWSYVSLAVCTIVQVSREGKRVGRGVGEEQGHDVDQRALQRNRPCPDGTCLEAVRRHSEVRPVLLEDVDGLC